MLAMNSGTVASQQRNFTALVMERGKSMPDNVKKKNNHLIKLPTKI